MAVAIETSCATVTVIVLACCPECPGDSQRVMRMKDNTLTLNVTEAAKMVGLAPSTLAKLRLNGNGPVYCKLGRRVVYRRADLEQWLESRKTRNTSDADARFLKALTAAHPR